MQKMECEQIIAEYPERRCETRNGIVSYREAGSGTVLVLLHGISSGAASWAFQLHGLNADCRVIAWDAPGYGASTPLAKEAPRAPDYAGVLEAFVDALALERFVLVGHSLGALMAAAYAQANPQRVQRLILMSPARGYGMASPEEREHRFSRRMEMLDRLDPEGLACERAPALLSPSASAQAVACVEWNMRRLHPGGHRQAARMLADDDIGRYASDYRAPVAVFSGSADHITPVHKCRAVAELFRAGSYESAGDLGHALYVENPERINEFLQQQAGTGQGQHTRTHGRDRN